MFNKKMILMLVLLTALVASAATAGDYKVYGKMHSSINMLSNGDESQIGLSSNSSRFGIKGTAEMNDSFSFIWQFESKLDMASGSGTEIGQRNTFVGFNNEDFGTFVFGNHDTPFKTLGRKVELFGDQLGDFRTLTSRGPLYSIRNHVENVEGIGVVSWSVPESKWDNRLGEVVAWVSPDFDGFSLFVAYLLDQGDKLNYTDPAEYEAVNVFSGMASYDKDGIFVGAAIEMHGNNERPYYDTGDNFDNGDPILAYGDAPMALRFAAKYTAEKLIVTGFYQSISGQLRAGIDDEYAFGDITATTLGLGAKFMVNDQIAFKGQYFMQNEWTDVDDGLSPSLMALGVDYKFQKNVTLYAQYAAVSNDDITNVALGGTQSGYGTSVEGVEALDEDGEGLGIYGNPSGFSTGVVMTW